MKKGLLHIFFVEPFSEFDGSVGVKAQIKVGVGADYGAYLREVEFNLAEYLRKSYVGNGEFGNFSVDYLRKSEFVVKLSHHIGFFVDSRVYVQSIVRTRIIKGEEGESVNFFPFVVQQIQIYYKTEFGQS